MVTRAAREGGTQEKTYRKLSFGALYASCMSFSGCLHLMHGLRHW